MIMEFPEDLTENCCKRLHRIKGQVEGIERMLLDKRDCKDIITQISAAAKALEQVGFNLVASGISYCLENPEQAEEEGYQLDDIRKMFLKLS